MNSAAAVLLALVLILVVLLVVWLVLRSRTSDAPRGSTPYGPGSDAGQPAASVVDRMPPHQAQTDDADASDADATVAEEFVTPGLSELDAEVVDEAEPGDASGDGDGADSPPRTPTEAFGSANASGDSSEDEGVALETSVLDNPDAHSTPLFRSIREELLGTSTPPEEPPQEAGGSTVEDALAEEVVSAHPEVAQTWSHERRGWDEQAHAESDEELDGSFERQAAAEKEDKVSETHEETIGAVVDVQPDVMPGEHPPIVRISDLREVVDGGFGMGSAATLADGAQPLGHPIKANRDTKTYQDLHSPWYDETEPDVWFLDAGFAERAGFRRAE